MAGWRVRWQRLKQWCPSQPPDPPILIQLITEEAARMYRPGDTRRRRMLGPAPTIEQINELIIGGHTEPEIAGILGRTQQLINYVRRTNRDRAVRTPLEKVREYWPWGRMPTRYHKAGPFRHLKMHSTAFACGPDKVSFDARQRLDTFYRTLAHHNVVVRFHPEIEGGFEYVPRRRRDGDLMIRVDDQVSAKVDTYFKALWTLPKKYRSGGGEAT